MNKINWGIIATGKIAAKLAEAINYSDNSILYAVASRSDDKAIAFAKNSARKSATAVTNSLQMTRTSISST